MFGQFPAHTPFVLPTSFSVPYTGQTYAASSPYGFDVQGDPTLDPAYVQGGGSGPTYTPPDQWNRNLNVLPGGQPTDTSSWIWVALIGVVIVAVMFGGRH